MASEFNVVEMGSVADTEDNNELVLAAIKRPLTGVRIDPHDDVQGFVISRSAGFHDFGHVPPVAAHEVDRARARDPAGIAQRGQQKLDIFRTRHFA